MKKLFLCLKLIFAFFILAILFYRIPFGQTLGVLENIPIAFLVAVFALSSLANLLCACKLRFLIAIKDKGIKLLSVVRAYYVGIFFNNFMPTEVGGDVFKIGELKKENLQLQDVTAAVILERITGAMALVILALALSFFDRGIFEHLGIVSLRTKILGAALLLATVFIMGYIFWRSFLKSFLEERKEMFIWGKIYNIIQAFYIYKDNLWVIILALAFSLVFHLLGVANITILAFSIEGAFSFFAMLMVVVVVRLVSMLPVSIGALGVREGMLIFCLTRVGLDAPSALALGIILRANTYIHSAIGAVLYIFRK
ncbi:MAG: flippase-like domain-containing protein [Candidatus Omnitrophica bacterium]|nr:flippase-like domain-containing protein [Candidatus Omnitrophota bacterium]